MLENLLTILVDLIIKSYVNIRTLDNNLLKFQIIEKFRDNIQDLLEFFDFFVFKTNIFTLINTKRMIMKVNLEEKYKILIISIFYIFFGVLTYYLHFIYEIDTVYTHLFYFPLILSCFWWEKKGFFLSIFINGILIFFPVFWQPHLLNVENISRLLIMILIGIFTVFLSEKTSNSMEKLIENENKIKNFNRKLEQKIEERTKELKKSKEMLEDHYNQLNNIFLNIKDIVFVISEKYIILFGNTTAYHVFGKEFIGKTCYEILKGINHPCEQCPINTLNENYVCQTRFEQIIDTPFINKRSDFDIIISQIENYGGQPSILEVLRDITERKILEKELHQLNEELELRVKERTKELNKALEQQKLYQEQLLKSSQFKSEFMASMSHELRTPLNSIIGFTDVILERISGEINEEQDKYLSNVKTSALLLLDLINDVLDIAKIEAGKVELQIENIILSNIINQINTMLKPTYEKKNLTFEIQKFDKEKVIRVDRLRFKEILFNLLSNAVKYTKEGKVKLEFSENEKYWKFNVIDTGIGIKEKDFDLIFQDFKRIRSVNVASIEGTGLGLSLTKKLVELHGGNISFTSNWEKGSTFTFTIPKNIK